MTEKLLATEGFDPDRLAVDRLFCGSLEEDPWVVFHGTSSVNGDAIERQGLRYDCSSFSKAELQSIVDVFDLMKWLGSDNGGYGSLASYSRSDFEDADSSPIFLSESSVRALLYATPGYAGGEKLRGVRRSLADLRRYVTDESIRTSHMATQQAKFDHLKSMNIGPDLIEENRPNCVDLDWLSAKLCELQPIQEKAISVADNHQSGIVFALRLQESDLSGMTYDPNMGIKARKTIPPERIVSKVNIPIDFVFNSLAIPVDHDLHMMRLQSGVVQCLRTRVNSGAV